MDWDTPLARFTALGLEIDLASQQFFVPEKKVTALKSLIQETLDDACAHENRVHAKRLAAVAGRVVSMSLALGGVSRVRTRCLYKCVGVREK